MATERKRSAAHHTSQTELKQIKKQYSEVSTDVEQDILTVQAIESAKMQDALNNARLQELGFKQTFRIWFSLFAAGLLIWQNWEVFSLVEAVFHANQLEQLQAILSVLVGATLTETYFILRIIVKFVFSGSDYRYERE